MRLILVITCLALGACGGGASDDDTVGAEIAEDYNDAMDKAAEVETQLEEHQQAVEEAVQKAEDAPDR